RAPGLTPAEQAFLEGPVEELCRMLNSWEITHERADLPPAVWDFLREQRFFGMIIPAEFGGLGFSAYAHSQVVMKVSSRSPTAGVSVMVPNSLGPAELLLHYGTDEQKDHYLPLLADGREIPCFALTGPFAGSDAASIPDVGVVCWGEHEGEAVLGLRTNWEKRYITLGPIATVLGLAFQARDPDGLLGEEVELGVTCALIPTETPGVEIGQRHDPLGTAFQNGPNRGHDVFIPIDWIIGGREGVGRGWGMLMDCLSAGRGISLPALGCGSGKYCSRLTGAYARVRHQFKRPIGHFEGVEEPLARIAAKTYMMDSARQLTLAAIDAGEKPAVASAMVKHFNTEGNRDVVNDAMDIHGGRGICEGPSNYLTIAYRAVPVAITVEGANILTRSMIVFGQGAMRCHPYLIDEIKAAQSDDAEQGARDFDAALLPHIGHTVRNAARAFVYGLSRSRLAPAPVRGPSAKYYRRVERLSAAFALVADAALVTLGGDLKRRERLSARFADALIHLYVCSAALKRFEDTGRPPEDLPLLEWSAKYCLYNVQSALDEILRNFPITSLGVALRWIIFPLGRSYRYPNDRLGHRVARMLLEPSDTRDRLTHGIYVDERPNDLTGRMEHALRLAVAAEPLEQRLRKRGIEQPVTTAFSEWVVELVRAGVLDETEAGTLGAWRDALRAAIDVDDFAPALRYRIDEPDPPEAAGSAGPDDPAPAATSDEAAATVTGTPEHPNSRI
ncbi:MAG: acyl-CoA dehydrogenase, partial [Halofilum sp. (in: g-proteobacteria)]